MGCSNQVSRQMCGAYLEGVELRLGCQDNTYKPFAGNTTTHPFPECSKACHPTQRSRNNLLAHSRARAIAAPTKKRFESAANVARAVACHSLRNNQKEILIMPITLKRIVPVVGLALAFSVSA